ncbi:MAG: NAD(P)-dependent oxidoreductase [Muribaculaceae bacterium]|nr:NAD(P)-dependent oxidoreductase [Muribaculaceae bacterium]
MANDNKKVLIVGAGGFIGGFIAKEGLRRGYKVWAGVRATTSRRYLDYKDLNFAIFDYDSPQSIANTLKSLLPEGERFDYIIYNLGATKCANFLDFNRINFDYLRNFTQALTDTDMVPERFLMMSSLSAVGPIAEDDYRPITERDIPQPNTRYGVSKTKAETHLMSLPDFPYIIFRATGVYGPHEQDYLMMIKCIDRHFDFGVGFKKQLLTFIYVEDLVNAMYDALESGVKQRVYNIAEPRSYTQREFRSIVSKELGRKWVIPLKLPMWMVYVASSAAEQIGKLRMKPSTLNRDKYRILKQRNWACSVEAAERDFGFIVKYPLVDGVKATVAAYLDAKKK